MKIIVVDTSSTVRIKIEELLIDLGFDGLDINLFEDAELALEYIRTQGADLIFSSIETNGMDGVTFVDLILQEKPEYVSHLFIVTSQTKSANFEDVKGVGAKRFIKKPINEEYFRHMIKPEIDKALRKT